MNLVLLTLVSIVGPMTPSTPAAESPACLECPAPKSEIKTPAQPTAKVTPKDAKSAVRTPADSSRKPAPVAPVVRKPRHPAYLFM
jgi:hypothetical protein